MLDILNQFLSSKLMVRDSSIPALEIFLSKLINSGDASDLNTVSDKDKKRCAVRNNTENVIYPDWWNFMNPFEGAEKNSIALIPIVGYMFKHGWWFTPGMDEIAEVIRMADKNPDILGIILSFDTPGGVVDSIFQIEDALRNRTKPCVAFIDGMCCSGGIYAASFCDEIYAVNKMCEIGSVGTYATIVDDTKYYEDWGVKITYVYPPESKFKNLTVREAREGKPERLIKEELTPFAIHFQDIIKKNRRRIDLSVEGIIEGRVFYAQDAVKHHLIDGIGNLDKIVSRIEKLSLDSINNLKINI
jgi:protease-4